jgi:hypothetical protein
MTEQTLIRRTDRYYCLPVLIDSRLPKADQMLTANILRVELFDGRMLIVPARFLTDCHSTPLWLASLLPEYDNRTNIAAIVHDYLYMHWETFAADQGGNIADGRSYSDLAYLNLMRQFYPGGWRNKLYYRAVRLFGGWNWRQFRQRYREELTVC